MNLKELKDDIDYFCEQCPLEKELKDIPVLITLAQSSIGSRASVEIKSVNMGIDWEHGQLRIEPIRPIIDKLKDRDNSKDVIERFDYYTNKKYYICPACYYTIAKKDKYCRYCGQKLNGK